MLAQVRPASSTEKRKPNALPSVSCGYGKTLFPLFLRISETIYQMAIKVRKPPITRLISIHLRLGCFSFTRLIIPYRVQKDKGCSFNNFQLTFTDWAKNTYIKGERANKFPMRRRKKKLAKRGTVLRTRDGYLLGGHVSPHEQEHLNKRDLYRRVFIVESNERGEIAVIEVQSKGVLIRKDGSIRDKHHGIIHTAFYDGSPLKKRSGFLEKRKSDPDYTKDEALEALKYAINIKNPNTRRAISNRAKLKALKKKGFSKLFCVWA